MTHYPLWWTQDAALALAAAAGVWSGAEKDAQDSFSVEPGTFDCFLD